MIPAPDRLVPDLALPTYTYVPGQTPRPRDPAGHGCGLPPKAIPFSLERWPQCQRYQYGIDLFNRGYYWEAHEAWEEVWLAAGRRGPAADLLKGLIKLAAAGVKSRQGQPHGRRRHALRAAQLFQQASLTLAGSAAEPPRLMGLPLDELIAHATAAAESSEEEPGPAGHPPRVFAFRIVLQFPDEGGSSA